MTNPESISFGNENETETKGKPIFCFKLTTSGINFDGKFYVENGEPLIKFTNIQRDERKIPSRLGMGAIVSKVYRRKPTIAAIAKQFYESNMDSSGNFLNPRKRQIVYRFTYDSFSFMSVTEAKSRASKRRSKMGSISSSAPDRRHDQASTTVISIDILKKEVERLKPLYLGLHLETIKSRSHRYVVGEFDALLPSYIGVTAKRQVTDGDEFSVSTEINKSIEIGMEVNMILAKFKPTSIKDFQDCVSQICKEIIEKLHTHINQL